MKTLDNRSFHISIGAMVLEGRLTPGGRGPAAARAGSARGGTGRQDFLWFMSSDFFLRLPQLLPRHRRQVVLLVIGHLAFPHHEDDL